MHPGTPGTCLRREQAWEVFRLVSPAEGTSAMALVHFHQLLDHPLCMLGNYLSLRILCLDRSKWPFLWHGWLPGLCGIRDNDPWAASFHDLASAQLDQCLGAYPVDFAGSWTPP